VPTTWPEEHIARRGWRETTLLLLLPPLFTAAATLAAGMLADSETTALAWARLIVEREYIGQGRP
jgi:multicomponent Na+:H+ antiporter subunit D